MSDRLDIQLDRSKTGNYADYSTVAAIENLILSVPVGESAEVNPAKKISGEIDETFSTVRTLIAYIRKRGGPVCRLVVKEGYAIIHRVK